MGANLGAGLIPLSLAAGTGTAARRVLYGNLAMRAAGVVLAAPLAAEIATALAPLAADAPRQVANLHTAFNAALLGLFLPLIALVAALLLRLWPDPTPDQAEAAVNHLDPALLDRPDLALNAATREVMRMADRVELMLQLSLQAFASAPVAARIRDLEAQVDEMHDEVKLYLSRLMQNPLGQRQGDQVMNLILFTINLENVGDIIDRGLMAMADKKRRLDLTFTDDGWDDIVAVHARTLHQMRLAMTVFVRGDAAMARDLVDGKDRMRDGRGGLDGTPSRPAAGGRCRQHPDLGPASRRAARPQADRGTSHHGRLSAAGRAWRTPRHPPAQQHPAEGATAPLGLPKKAEGQRLARDPHSSWQKYPRGSGGRRPPAPSLLRPLSPGAMAPSEEPGVRPGAFPRPVDHRHRTQPELRKRSSGTRAWVRDSPCTALAAVPAPCTITERTAEHSTSTASAVMRTSRNSGPWLE